MYSVELLELIINCMSKTTNDFDVFISVGYSTQTSNNIESMCKALPTTERTMPMDHVYFSGIIHRLNDFKIR